MAVPRMRMAMGPLERLCESEFGDTCLTMSWLFILNEMMIWGVGSRQGPGRVGRKR